MAIVNRSKNHGKYNKHYGLDNGFSKIGGLNNHIKLLREIIITPLLHGELFQYFNIKAPRGVLFFGPPGTGKTLIAGALASEVNNERHGKVTFIQRKGADILDKWVGESERKLRELFDKAAKYRPSIIFFDELDGLAPERSQKNDQVHCSIVATLLALMDGLDNMPGVVVIGATNRIDAIDPALRRPGRFDRELYFPLPTTIGRKEILGVHTNSWRHKPSVEFLNKLAELSAGCCGSDLQALCTEAVMCCVKRLYPDFNKANSKRIKMNLQDIKVEECDFLTARLNLIPTIHRMGTCKQRSLSPFIAPLLASELDKILRNLRVFLSHFLEPDKKFLLGNERYAGRLVLKGTNQQGLYTHLLPAVLQVLEHLPNYVLEVPHLFESTIKKAQQQLPSVLVLSRVDEWWDMMENNALHILKSVLEDFHAGLPLLIVVTCVELPDALKEYFYNNSSIIFKIADPKLNEREAFFKPIFYGDKFPSLLSVWKKQVYPERVKKEIDNGKDEGETQTIYNTRSKAKRRRRLESNDVETEKNLKRKCSYPYSTNSKRRHVEYLAETTNNDDLCPNLTIPGSTVEINDDEVKQQYISTLDTNLKHFSKFNSFSVASSKAKSCHTKDGVLQIKNEPMDVLSFGKNVYCFGDSKTMDRSALDVIWDRVINVTSEGLQVTQLELLYDTIKGCIYIYPTEYCKLIQALQDILVNFENSTHH